MRRIYWSLPALLLAGAVVWAQQPVGNPFNPNQTGTAASNPLLPASASNSGVDFITPAGASPQPIPASIRTVRTDHNGKVIYDSGVLPLGGAGQIMSGDPRGAMMLDGLRSGPMKAKQVQRTVIETQYVPLSEAEANELQIYQAAVATLKSDESADKKELARKQLFELLSVGFDRDLESRETDLKSLESRVQKLRSQLDKRKAAKQEIIDLRLKTIQNEADGLEYPGAATPPAETPILREPGVPADGT